MYIDEKEFNFDPVPANDPTDIETPEDTKGSENELFPLLTPEDVAELLSISTTSLNRGRCTHPENYPSFIKLGRTVRYRLCDILDWVDLNLQGGGL